MADTKIKVEMYEKINEQDVKFHRKIASTVKSEKLILKNLESSQDTINTQYNIEIADKMIKIETNTTEDIPLDEDQKSDLSVTIDNKSKTESRAIKNIVIQECNKIINPVITEAKDTIYLMETDEVDKLNLSANVHYEELFSSAGPQVPVITEAKDTIDLMQTNEVEKSYLSTNVNYEEIYSSACPQVVVKKEKFEESEHSEMLENIEIKRDLNEKYMELIRAISDDNDLVSQEYTPNQENTSEIVQEPHKFVVASGIKGTAFKLEIKEEPYDEIDEEDVIIFKKAAEENEMSELTIDQFILHNLEVTMPKIEPEQLLNDSSKSDTYVELNKNYHCANCDFVGIHRLYKEHKESCVKHHSLPRNGSMLKCQIKEYSCSKCTNIYENFRDYLLHFHLHELQPLQCPVCSLVQQSFGQYKFHVWNHVRNNFIKTYSIHADQKKSCKLYKCTKCKEIMQRGQIWEHWESHLQIGDKIKQKSEEIKTKANLMTPYIQYLVDTVMMSPHRKDDREILRSCQVCDDRKFSRWSELKRHLIEHLLKDARNKIQNDNLKCQICQQGVKSVEKYKRHMREHAGLSLYLCNLCNKTFSDSSNFAKHKKVHNLKVLFCDICNKKYQSKKTLARHLMKHNGSAQLTCDHCCNKFYFASDLKKHIRTKHYGQKFRCSICRERFSSVKLKWTHEWEIHRERKVKADCPICNEQFRKFQEVKHHVKVHHHGIYLDKKIYKLLEKINESNLDVDEIDNIFVKKLEGSSFSDVE